MILSMYEVLAPVGSFSEIDIILNEKPDGINAFECKNVEQAEYASQIGAIPYLVYGYPKYLTLIENAIIVLNIISSLMIARRDV